MVHVFKTSVQNKTQVANLKPYLDVLFGESHWNFDLEDCDNILRIESKNCSNKTVIDLLKIQNFNCKELE
ncbi:hypothetical protein [uncultured Zobellia sp.]|uniref:hypothetical protein n=1 Tax=uncultured Zobellia sp. TaxID=255433 RepID=UPI002599048B|nr:hypothetical protein [uncultured Zobellia sp.]